MAEAILSAEFSESDRKQWQQELEAWQAEVDNYGIDSGFAISLTALEEG
ncbi:MAG: hypothetical protein HC768_09640 [Acaryochloris sp. CRU_2_0]|nr:hypothetical protein [Acaryochloris sp. CRU_2_0]